jgi:hypothetical protein
MRSSLATGFLTLVSLAIFRPSVFVSVIRSERDAVTVALSVTVLFPERDCDCVGVVDELSVVVTFSVSVPDTASDAV